MEGYSTTYGPVTGAGEWARPVVLVPPGDRLLERLLTTRGMLVFLAAHAALAVAMSQSPLISTGHALATTGLATYWAMQGRDLRVAAAAAYIAGAEILWRMTAAVVPWEYGKYSVALVLLVALVRRRWIGLPVLALAYVFFLLPSTPLAFTERGLEQARQEISFNLSGPIALLIVAWFFHHIRIGLSDLRKLLLVLFGPILGIAAIAVFVTASADTIRFAAASNVIASGGFGPNQVSSMMGLGVMAGFLWAVVTRGRLVQRWLVFGLVLLLAVQAGLTFSRSGLALAALSISVAALFLLRNPRTRVAFIVIGVIAFLFVQYAMIPFLNDYTAGAFGMRFTDTSSTGRVELATYDLMIWKENFWVGVGPGQASWLRNDLGHGGAAHTEFTRALSEHGLMGLFSLIALLGIVGVNFLRARGPLNKGVVAALIVWGLGFMALNAFRIVAPALALGMTCATFLLNQPEAPRVAVPLPARSRARPRRVRVR